ncbi:MAG: hypothetical protein QOD83_349 [Solirubrobacteraceae bacterium]|nr:hypothetical protein [Solirubrobacteraceae bacterium]
MADRQDSDREVLTSLPRSRPVRRSAKRGAQPAGANSAKKGRDSSKPVAAQTPATTPRGKAGAGKPRPAADGAKVRAKPATTTSAARKRAAAGDRASAARPRTAGTRPRRETAPRREREPEREPERVAPARKVPPAGYAAPATRGERDSSDAAKLLSTAVQAANELAQIGLTVGRQALQSMLDRLPKP